MKLEDFDLQDKEFRDFILRNTSFELLPSSPLKITDKDLMRFYFEVPSNHIEKLLFNYKMRYIINDDRWEKFKKIIKEAFPDINTNHKWYYTELHLHCNCKNLPLLSKIVDIFFDEI